MFYGVEYWMSETFCCTSDTFLLETRYFFESYVVYVALSWMEIQLSAVMSISNFEWQTVQKVFWYITSTSTVKMKCAVDFQRLFKYFKNKLSDIKSVNKHKAEVIWAPKLFHHQCCTVFWYKKVVRSSFQKLYDTKICLKTGFIIKIDFFLVLLWWRKKIAQKMHFITQKPFQFFSSLEVDGQSVSFSA